MKDFTKQPIRLSSDRTWYHGDGEVTHKRTVDLFNKSVIFEKGRYFLTGEKKPVPIEVEDVAFFVKGLKTLKTEIVIKLSSGEEEVLDLTSLDITPENALYCVLNNGAPARFERKVYYDLMKGLSKKQGYYGLELDGVFYPLSSDTSITKPAPLKKSPAKKKAAPKKKVPAKKKAVKKKKATKTAVKKTKKKK